MNEVFFEQKRNLEEYGLEDLRVLIDGITRTLLKGIRARSDYFLNPVLYEKGRFDFTSGKSFLEYALQKKEDYYEAIGRFVHDLEFRTTEPSANSPFGEIPIKKANQPNVRLDGLMDFYIAALHNFSVPGDNVGERGHIVDIDCDNIMALNRRINIGRYVAERKLRENRELYRALVMDPTPINQVKLLKAFTRVDRENIVKERAMEFGHSIGLDEKKCGEFMEDVVTYCTLLQTEYISRLFNA